jgi:hypothetical protein
MLDQLTVADMDLFYASWKDGKRSRAKKLERLKAFVKFCLKRKLLSEDISDDLKAPSRTASRIQPKLKNILRPKRTSGKNSGNRPIHCRRDLLRDSKALADRSHLRESQIPGR